jgi:choline kinase
MKVIILAAGCGTRLRPHTNSMPKCMVELANKPLLHHQIATLRSVGLNDIIVVGGHRANKIKGKNIKIVLNKDYKTTNMVSTLFCAEEYILDNEDLIITYGDIVYEAKVLHSLIESKESISVSIDKKWYELWDIRMENPLLDAETLKLCNSKYIKEIGKTPKNIKEIEGQYMGLIKIKGSFIKEFKNAWHNLKYNDKHAKKNYENMYMTSFIQKFIDNGVRVEAAFTEGGWLEVDTTSDLNLYNDLYKKNKLSRLIKL